jgi:fructosamine-3-kinase
LNGKFESLKAIHNLWPGFVPKPIAQGSYISDPDIHFLLMGFLDITGNVPSVDHLPANLAEMHLKGVSPNGKFGFHMPTGLPFLQGELEQFNNWTSSWEALFTRVYIPIFHWEQALHGEDEEMQTLFKAWLRRSYHGC